MDVNQTNLLAAAIIRINELDATIAELKEDLRQTKMLLAEKITAEDLLAEKIMAIRLITSPDVDRATVEGMVMQVASDVD